MEAKSIEGLSMRLMLANFVQLPKCPRVFSLERYSKSVTVYSGNTYRKMDSSYSQTYLGQRKAQGCQSNRVHVIHAMEHAKATRPRSRSSRLKKLLSRNRRKSQINQEHIDAEIS